mmetsp:Transcript_112781/g.318844  ORF Transcript_112781/g.318844 Transcript_112781/m.318844 type:complete len:131 (-) Transcript_112781:163-555(-)
MVSIRKIPSACLTKLPPILALVAVAQQAPKEQVLRDHPLYGRPILRSELPAILLLIQRARACLVRRAKTIALGRKQRCGGIGRSPWCHDVGDAPGPSPGQEIKMRFSASRTPLASGFSRASRCGPLSISF